MIALALAVVGLLLYPAEASWIAWTNRGIYVVFVADYVIRLSLSGDRRAFVRRNVPDLIAIIPFDQFRIARLFRLARLVRLLRAGTVLWRASTDLRGVLRTNGLAYLLTIAGALILAGGLAIWWLEERIVSFGDGLWWAMVTATTVGYGDISPEGTAGRVVAAVLMLVGIGSLGMVTGSIATYFIAGREPPRNPHLEHVQAQIDRWSELSREERTQLAAILSALAKAEP